MASCGVGEGQTILSIDFMRKWLVLTSILLCPLVFAQVAPFRYRLGALPVKEDATSIVIEAPHPLHIDILAGGHTWPLLNLDEDGNIYVGDRIVNARQPQNIFSYSHKGGGEKTIALSHGYRVDIHDKAYQFTKGRVACTLAQRQLGLSGTRDAFDALKHGNIVFRASDQKVLALAARLGDDNSETTYSVFDIDTGHCRAHRTELGNPDLLVELQWSPGGGWWMTGSIEQTLLHSTDGRHWYPVALPKSISSLMSAYIVDDREIWLAGILPPDSRDDDPLIIHSSDGGKSWKNIHREDPVLKRMPVGWLEGWRRLGQPVRQ